MDPPSPRQYAGASHAAAKAESLPAAGGSCWPLPRPFFEAPFNASMASVVWTRPLDTEFGPLDDVPEKEREQQWSAPRRKRLLKRLPERGAMEATRFDTCAVVGSSPELLLYSDGAAIDTHDAVFRANLAKTEGFEEHVGRRTSVRIINPVEDVTKARKRGGTEIIIKNQAPPVIRSPSEQHGRFLTQSEGVPDMPNYLGRRQVLELCNFLFLMSGLALPPEAPRKKGRADPARANGAAGWSAATLNATLTNFRRYLADGRTEWHPLGSKIPRFSQSHCSTGTVLLVEALLLCRTTRLYGFHACSCARKCSATEIAGRNHYWDTKGTPQLDAMMSRYERHMLFYQLLERTCGLDFRIARKEHCDGVV